MKLETVALGYLKQEDPEGYRSYSPPSYCAKPYEPPQVGVGRWRGYQQHGGYGI